MSQVSQTHVGCCGQVQLQVSLFGWFIARLLKLYTFCRLPYKTIFGGVCALTKAQFIKVNGFSNQFWGWGGEDDDMYKRIMYQSMKVERYSGDIARYTMLKHGQQPKINRNRCVYCVFKLF